MGWQSQLKEDAAQPHTTPCPYTMAQGPVNPGGCPGAGTAQGNATFSLPSPPLYYSQLAPFLPCSTSTSSLSQQVKKT